MRAYPVAEWRTLRGQGLSYLAIAVRYGVSETTVRYRVGPPSTWARNAQAKRAWDNRHEQEQAIQIKASKGLAHCQRCGIILERSGCIGHGDDTPDAGYCWDCRERGYDRSHADES